MPEAVGGQNLKMTVDVLRDGVEERLLWCVGTCVPRRTCMSLAGLLELIREETGMTYLHP
jgi:hypothetical protein